ncbi:MAG: DUF4080 domain-containing protein [SAR324 cluster bacterium]|nr:DUF4080 domain-containing protein [SAR324 cluster bacterium]
MPTTQAMTRLTPDASIGLVTLNAKFVHVALSVRYLRNAARSAGYANVWIREFTIQIPVWKMAADIQAMAPAVVGFSIYIWNREATFALIELLKKQIPSLITVVGGPEVSFEPAPPTPYIDYVISGEGEAKWTELLALLASGRQPGKETVARWLAYGSDLPELRDLPYLEEDFAGLEHRLVYLETSRGCPFTCSFCLSALDRQVRFFDEHRVKGHIEDLIAAGVRRIKFLDRTFNLGKKRVTGLFSWLMQFQAVEFHFEVVGDLLDDQMIDLLEKAPLGMFQFEIGIQTTDEAVLNRIQRRQKVDRLFDAIRRLRTADRVNIHADLIWGLPGESVEQIRSTFADVVALRPHQLQLGFLKFLPGAPIRRLIDEEAYVYQDGPPYEVISNRLLSATAILELKRFEEVFDLYYNSQRFGFTLERLYQVMSPWNVFQRLSEYFSSHNLLLVSHSLDNQYRYLWECFRPELPEEEFRDLLKLDYFCHHRAHRVPDFLQDTQARGHGLAGSGTPRAGGRAPRAARRSGAHTSVAAFVHHIEIGAHEAKLKRASHPVWYEFNYPREQQGYFFRPKVRLVE